MVSMTAQVTMRTGNVGGGKEYLNVLAPESAQNIDTLFARVSAQGVELDTLFDRTDSLRLDADTLYARLAATSASIPDSVDWANITAPIINFTNSATNIDFDVNDITLDTDDWDLRAADDLTFYTEAHAQFISEDDMVIGTNDDDYYWDTATDVTDGSDSLDIYIVFDAEDDYAADFDIITSNLDGDEMQIISEDDLLIQAGQSDGNDISIEMVSLEDAMAFKATTIYAAGKFMPTHLVLPTSIPANPVAGSIYLDGAFIKYYNGTSWEMLSVVP
jgi:hypothetical protein